MCKQFGGAIVCMGGPEYRIRSGVEEFRFEFHNFLGPSLLTKRGDIAKQQRYRSPFWKAVSLWAQQGKRVDEAGWCVWEPEPDPLEGAVRIGKRTYVSKQIWEEWKMKHPESEPYKP